MSYYQKIYRAVMEGEDITAQEEAQFLLNEGVSPLDIINNGLIAAMEEIGVLFKEGELFIPEVMMSAQTVTAVIEMLKPYVTGITRSRGIVVIGTVRGDLHDIGKNLVALLFSSNGFSVHDLGNDVAEETFVKAAHELNADIVALSALLTTTMVNMETTIKAFIEAGLRDRVKIIIGGAPVSAEYAEAIGADGYSEDAQGAVELVEKLLEDKK